MKTFALAAAVLACALARGGARADDGAYGSLVGMARTAAVDRGPEDAPPPDAGGGARREAPARGAAPDPAERAGLHDAVAAVPPRPAAPGRAPAGAGADAVEAPRASAPRVWTRLYSTLLPSWRRREPGSFDAAVSTAPARPAPSDPAAVRAGERRGLAELLSASAAPADVQ